KETGRMAEARAAFAKALELDPKLVGVYVNVTDMYRVTAEDPHLAAMRALEPEIGKLTKRDRMHLRFALAKAYGDLGDSRRSFEHLLQGNALKRAEIAYDEVETHRFFERIEEVFTPALLRAAEGHGCPAATPIFVLGMPRSGTTLVEQILASHPDVHGAGELKTLNDIAIDQRDAGGPPLPSPEFVRGYGHTRLRELGERYLGELRGLAPAAARITDKMPANFHFVGLIHLALPNARIVHVMRDPVDTCLSCFSKLFAAPQNYS